MRFFIALGMGALAACSSGDQATVDGGGGANAASPDGGRADGASPIEGEGGVTTNDGASAGRDATTNDGASADGDVTTSDGDVTTSDGASARDGGPLYPAGRLFVSMKGAALGVWDRSSSITTDVPPTFTLSDSSVTSGTLGLALANKRLLVGTSQATGAVLAFDGADALTGSAAPAAKIPASQLVAASSTCSWSPSQLTWDAKSDSLWFGNDCGTERLSGASALGSSSAAKALFTHPWSQLPGVAYDPIGDRLFLGQISGAGILAYGGGASASGAPAPSFTLSQSSAAWSMTIDGDRLYASMGDGTLAVWNGVSGVSAAKAPDFTMGASSGLSGFPAYVGVNGDVLVVCTQSGAIRLWTHASTLGGETTPTQTITIGNPKKALLGPVSGRLYVMDDEGISIYEAPTTAPALVAKIKSGIVSPTDFAVLE